jgi:hypothetical protein
LTYRLVRLDEQGTLFVLSNQMCSLCHYIRYKKLIYIKVHGFMKRGKKEKLSAE